LPPEYRLASAWTRRRRGAALVEFALAIPILALVIALTFFCGYALTNKQHVTSACRYVVWSGAYGQPAPSDEEMNEMFLASKGRRIGIDQGGWPAATPDDLVDWAAGDYPPAGALMDQCIGDRSAHGLWAELTAEFPSSVGAWQSLIGPRTGLHFRDGGHWTRGELSYLEPIREQFLADLDQAVMNIQQDQDSDSPMVNLAGALRGLYSQNW
jgi:hypothetical protein